MQARGTLRNVCQNCGKFCHHYGEEKRWDASVESETSALCRQGELCEMCAKIVGSFAIITERGNAGMRAWKVRRVHYAGKGNSAKCVPKLWEVLPSLRRGETLGCERGK